MACRALSDITARAVKHERILGAPERLRKMTIVMTGRLCRSVAARLAQSVLKAQL